MAKLISNVERERWEITNRTSRNIAIGDLPFIPVLTPGMTVDLLRFYDKDVVMRSDDLNSALKARWIILRKIAPNESRTVPVSQVDKATISAEEDDIDVDLEDYYTKDEVEAIVAAAISGADNVYIVNTNPKPGQYPDLSSAIAAISSPPSETNIWLIKVEPGEYTDSEVTIPSWVFVTGYHIRSVRLRPSGNHHVIVMSENSGLQNVTIENAPSGKAGVYAYDVGNFGLINKVTFSGCDIGVWTVSENVESAFFMEYVDFTDCSTNSVLAQSLSSNEMSVNGENIYFEYSSSNPTDAFKIDGDKVEVNIQGMSGIGCDDLNGNCFGIYNGGYLNISSGRIEEWGKAFYVDSSGSEPYLKVQAIDLDENTVDVEIGNTGCRGFYQGGVDISKMVLNETAPWFIANYDRHIVTVAKHGGDFTSVRDAVEYAKSYSPPPAANNKFLIQVGPGVFEEDTIEMESNVYIDGVQRFATEIKLNTANPLNDYLILSQGKKTSISNCILNGTAGKTTVKYEGGLFRLIAIRFYTTETGVEATNIDNAAENALQFNDVTVGPGETVQQFVHISAGSQSVRSIFNNVSLSDGIVKNFVYAENPNTTVRLTNSRIIQSSSRGETAIFVKNGVRLQLIGSIVQKYTTGLSCPNLGAAPDIQLLAVMFEDNTTDVSILHTEATGNINGVFDKDTSIVDSPFISVIVSDPDDGSLSISGDFYQGSEFNLITNYTPMITRGQPLGVIYGGDLSAASGDTELVVESGYGYLLTDYDEFAHAILVSWDTQNIVFPDEITSKYYYVYIDELGDVKIDESRPDIFRSIILGRVYVTSSEGVVFIQDIKVDAESMSTKLDRTLRLAIGPIYAGGGSQISGTGLALNVTPGEYYYGTHQYQTSGMTAGVWKAWYHSGGSWTHKLQNSVDTGHYDNGTNLAHIPGTDWIRHTFYIVNDDSVGHESYHLVYGQVTYATKEAAESATSLNTPPPWTSNMVLIASIIAQKGAVSISTFIDERPRIGFSATGVSSSNLHSGLLGLEADDHPQYLIRTGIRPMTGSLNMDSHDILNVLSLDMDGDIDMNSNTINNLGSLELSGDLDMNSNDIINVNALEIFGTVNLNNQDITNGNVITSTSFVGTLTGNASNVSGIVALDHGGTNDNLIASNGGIVYSTATALAILSGTPTAGKILRSGSSSAPSWSTPTFPNAATASKVMVGDGTNWTESTVLYPSTTTANRLLYSSALNTIGEITTTASRVLISSAGGVPQWDTSLPSGTTLNGNAIYAAGTTVAVADGGTNITSYAQGDLLYASATTTISKLAKDTNATRYLSNKGANNNPSWSQITLTDGVTGTLPIGNGGTNASSFTAGNSLIVTNAANTALAAATAITGSRALISDANGIPVASSVTSTELGYLSGITGSVKTVSASQSTNATTSLTTTAGQVVLVLARVDITHNNSNAYTITLQLGGVTKDSSVIKYSNTNQSNVFLHFVETPGATTQNLTIGTTGGSIITVKYTILKIG